MHHLPRLDGGNALHGALRSHVLRLLPRRLAAQEPHLPHLPVSAWIGSACGECVWTMTTTCDHKEDLLSAKPRFSAMRYASSCALVVNSMVNSLDISQLKP